MSLAVESLQSHNKGRHPLIIEFSPRLQLILSVLFVIFGSESFAISQISGAGGPTHRLVTCERQLLGNHAIHAKKLVSDGLFNRTFELDAFYREGNAGVLKAFGLDLNTETLSRAQILRLDLIVRQKKDDLDPIHVSIQSLQNDTLLSPIAMSFPDTEPVLLQRISVPGLEKVPHYLELTDANPVPDDDLSRRRNEYGFHSDPAVSGVRRFLSFSYPRGSDGVQITLGIDVPCDHIEDYTGPSEELLKIISPGQSFCRITVFWFKASRR